LPSGKSLSFVGNRCIGFRFDGREACFAKPPSHCQKKVTKEKATRSQLANKRRAKARDPRTSLKIGGAAQLVAKLDLMI
jgi:hypothetical protein